MLRYLFHDIIHYLRYRHRIFFRRPPLPDHPSHLRFCKLYLLAKEQSSRSEIVCGVPGKFQHLSDRPILLIKRVTKVHIRLHMNASHVQIPHILRLAIPDEEITYRLHHRLLHGYSLIMQKLQ